MLSFLNNVSKGSGPRYESVLPVFQYQNGEILLDRG